MFSSRDCRVRTGAVLGERQRRRRRVEVHRRCGHAGSEVWDETENHSEEPEDQRGHCQGNVASLELFAFWAV